MQLLIVESETPETIARSGHSLATDYGDELRRISPDLVYTVSEPYLRPLTAIDLEMVEGVVFPGAGVKWSVNETEGAPIARAMETVFEAGLPCFGSCNGMQLAAWLLGGSVTRGEPEVGVARDVALTVEGASHPMLLGRPSQFSVPTVHGDQVSELPAGALHLAQNHHTRVQAFAYSGGGVDFWGVEYHPEISAAEIARYINANRDHFSGFQDLIPLLERAETDSEAAASLGTTLEEMSFEGRTTELRNWLTYLSEKCRPV